MNWVHVTALKRLQEFWEQHPDSEQTLRRWLEAAEDARWQNILDVRRQFPHADAVEVASGRTVTVFNIAGNKYRLIAAIHYNRQNVYAMMVLTHADYDRQRWKEEL